MWIQSRITASWAEPSWPRSQDWQPHITFTPLWKQSFIWVGMAIRSISYFILILNSTNGLCSEMFIRSVKPDFHLWKAVFSKFFSSCWFFVPSGEFECSKYGLIKVKNYEELRQEKNRHWQERLTWKRLSCQGAFPDLWCPVCPGTSLFSCVHYWY